MGFLQKKLLNTSISGIFVLTVWRGLLVLSTHLRSSFYTFLSLRTATEQIKRAAWLCLASSLPNAHDTVHTASIT